MKIDVNTGEWLPAGPFIEWFDKFALGFVEEADIRHGSTDYERRARGAIGWDNDAGTRRLYRWRHEQEHVRRDDVEDALDRAGVDLLDLYPDAAIADVELEPAAYCRKCRTSVTPIEGQCPWCDDEVSGRPTTPRRYCPGCDCMMRTAHNGTCWRCGSDTTGTPIVTCKCGCGGQRARFDNQGRERLYLNGHNPRVIEAAPGATHTCPECGAAKHPRAKLCRGCRTLFGSDYRRSVSLTDEFVEAAKNMTDVGMTLPDVAKRMHPETLYLSPQSLLWQLRREFRKRGWETNIRDRRKAVAA